MSASAVSSMCVVVIAVSTSPVSKTHRPASQARRTTAAARPLSAAVAPQRRRPQPGESRSHATPCGHAPVSIFPSSASSEDGRCPTVGTGSGACEPRSVHVIVVAAIDWSSTLSAGIGAIAALIGVTIAQRSERQKAQADRVWAQRADCYRRILAWSNDFRTHAFYRRLADMQGDTIPDPPRAFDGEVDARLFASQPVYTALDRLNELAVALYGRHLMLTPKFELPDKEEEKRQKEQARVEALAYSDMAAKQAIELADTVRFDIEPSAPRWRTLPRRLRMRLLRRQTPSRQLANIPDESSNESAGA